MGESAPAQVRRALSPAVPATVYRVGMLPAVRAPGRVRRADGEPAPPAPAAARARC